jgi:large subunit ribosomal protein L4
MSNKLVDISGKDNGTFELASLFIDKPNKQCMFEQVIAEDAGRRQATVNTLTRGEVRGGGKKPRPQKHTGRAQLGSIRASHCVGGGNSFGPRTGRNYKLYLNDKAGAVGLKSAFTVKDSNIYVLEDAKLNKPSTVVISKLLKALKIYGKKVLVIGNDNADLVLSAKNIARVTSKN